MTVRFFTSLMLRTDEEVDGTLAPWLPHVATVEFDAQDPVTAVWQSATGDRRIAWYGSSSTEQRVAHVERYGDEPCWLLRRHVDANGRLAVDVEEIGAAGEPIRRRAWTFDAMGMPATDVETSAGGDVVSSRIYRCLPDGLVTQLRERKAPAFAETVTRRVAAPVPELAAEPFPCGATLAGGTVRLLTTISENAYQGRYRSVAWDGERWASSITTLAATSSSRLAAVRPVLDLADEDLALLVAEGHLEGGRVPPGRSPYGITELVPPGQTVLDAVASGRFEPTVAMRVAVRVAEVARRAQARGTALSALRPELVYVVDRGAGIELSRILHRAPAFLSTAARGEALLWPPAFRSDFGSRDDVQGLAQLLWFMATGTHPFLAPENVTWEDSWTHVLHSLRARQPWRGPAALEPLLTRCLFDAPVNRPTLDELLVELRSFVS